MFKEYDVVRLKVDKTLSEEILSSDRYQPLTLLSAGAKGTVVYILKNKKSKKIFIL